MLEQEKIDANKRRNFRAYALVMSANFETVAVFISSYYLSQYFKENYQISDRTQNLIYLISLILICRSWFVMLKQLVKFEKEKGEK